MTTRAAAARPVTVLTGALGAGKTTLLNAVLKADLGGRVAVVVNEFGTVGIDHELVRQSTEDVVLLPGGCLCCAVRSDLAEALMRLDRAQSRKEVNPFERVVIETSGLAEPGPILQLFAESSALRGRYRLDVVTTVVDAVLGGATLATENTALRQVALADRLLINKVDAAPRNELPDLQARLHALNPFAERALVQPKMPDSRWFEAASSASGRAVPEHLMRAAHDESIESFCLRWREARGLAEIGVWLHELAATFGARLLRVKGIVRVRERAQPVVIQVVQHLVAEPEFLSGDDQADDVSDSRVVLIVRGLEPGDVRPAWPVVIGAS